MKGVMYYYLFVGFVFSRLIFKCRVKTGTWESEGTSVLNKAGEWDKKKIVLSA